jgi:Flp pilus assembly pilin Flp
MNKKFFRNAQRGQALPEYALTLILVSVVSIIILLLVGMAVSRIYAIVTALTGGKRQTTSISFTEAACYVVYPGAPGYSAWPNGIVGLFITGVSDIPLNELQLSTDIKFASNVTLNTSSTPGTFMWNPQWGTDGVVDQSLCPHAVTVQGRKQTAFSPIEIKIIK